MRKYIFILILFVGCSQSDVIKDMRWGSVSMENHFEVGISLTTLADTAYVSYTADGTLVEVDSLYGSPVDSYNTYQSGWESSEPTGTIAVEAKAYHGGQIYTAHDTIAINYKKKSA